MPALDPNATLALTGACLHLALAVLFLLAWRELRAPWAWKLSVGFALFAGIYSVNAWQFQAVQRAGPWLTVTALATSLSYAFMTSALADYVDAPPRGRRAVMALLLGLIAAAMLGVSLGWIDRRGAQWFQAAIVPLWCALFLWAARREPRSGHWVNILALLLMPLLTMLTHYSWLGAPFDDNRGVLPQTVLGLTLLTTAALRAQRLANQALAAQRRAEATLRQTNEALEQRIEQRTAHLREHIEVLESFNRNVSHDLRGPLGGIAGLAALTRDAVADGDTANALQNLDAMANQATQSQALVDALLQLARASSGDLQLAPVNTRALLAELLPTLPHLASAPVHCVTVSDGLPTVQADPVLLRQVFVNLVGNALKFGAGRPTLRVVVDAVRTDDATWQFSVSDNGPGFNAQAEGLFRPFQRHHQGNVEGTGVGLSVVQRIVEHHGGRVWAESAPSLGATFRFTLPG
jgi:signal transduction histidine kinase